jgi:hypothetical protein
VPITIKEPHMRQQQNRRQRSDAKRSALAALASLSLAALILAACGSTSPSASQQVCNERSQLNSAVSTVGTDLRSGNLSKAKDDLPAVHQAFNMLKNSVQQLAGEQREALTPQIDTLKSTVSGLKYSDSLTSLTAGISSAETQAQSISRQIGDTLHCS